MIAPRSAARSQVWFPPATFQLRLRSLKSVIFLASSKPRNGHNSGFFFISLHERPSSEAFWTSCPLAWSTERDETRLSWTDIDLSNCNVNTALKSVVVAVWFRTESLSDDETPEARLDTKWGIYFSGLWCLGTHPPPHGRLPANSIVLHMNGSYFSSADHAKDKKDTFIPRYMYIGRADESKTVGSYTTKTLARLQYIQRALNKQEDSNNIHKQNFAAHGVVSLSDLEEHLEQQLQQQQQRNRTNRSLVLAKLAVKSAVTRMKESQLKSQIERARVRVELLNSEKTRLVQENHEIILKQREAAAFIEEKSSFLMQCFHTLAKEKTLFKEWMSEFEQDCKAHSAWSSALRRQRLSLMYNMSFIFPIGNLSGQQPTLRYVALPAASELRDMAKNEIIISVVIGWLADLITIISRILDVPVRYPIQLQGSTSSITDHLKSMQVLPEGESRLFPLYLGRGSSDWSRFEYAIYLLNKNLAQLRWECSLTTADLRPILHNANELIELGEKIRPLKNSEVDALPKLKTLSAPPTSIEHQVVIKSGRAHIRNSNRPMSPSKAIGGPGSKTSTLDRQPYNNIKESDEDLLYSSGGKVGLSLDLDDDDGASSSSESATSFDEEMSKPAPPSTLLTPTSSTSKSPSRVRSKSTSSSPEGSTTLTPSSMVESPSTGGSNIVFWGDVTSRAIVLSNPSLFQRPRASQL